MSGNQKQACQWRRWFLRGESVVAGVGIGVTIILLVTVSACTWWMLSVQEDDVRRNQTKAVASLGQTLAPTLELLLANDQLTVARRLVLDAAKEHQLTKCDVVLPGGDILASSTPAKITAAAAQGPWPRGPLDLAPAEEGFVALGFPMVVHGRGGAILHLTAPLRGASVGFMESTGGIGMITAAGLCSALLFYRATRRRSRGLGLIREAILAFAAGETSEEALHVSQSAGCEASAWNQLIEELLQLRNKTSFADTRNSLNMRGGGGEQAAACDAIPMGLLVISVDGSVTYANGAAAVMLQVKKEALLGATIESLSLGDDLQRQIRAALGGTSRQRIVAELERPSDQGGGVFRITVRPLRRSEGSSVLLCMEDISQHRVAQAARFAFVAQTSHELRTPLTNIRAYIETAIDEGKNDATLRAKCLNIISQETRRLERMVTEMLSVSEIESGSLKLKHDDLRIDRLLNELHTEYQAQAEDKKLSLKFELSPKLPVIQADREKLVLALHNVIGNALKYTPSGGSVTVQADADDKQVSIAVTDTGLGIEEKEQQLIFDRFYRSKDPRIGDVVGTGLGLAIAQEVVRRHGGDITVRSQLDQGSVFTITVPTAKAA